MAEIQIMRATVGHGLRCPKCGGEINSGDLRVVGEDLDIIRLDCAACHVSVLEAELESTADYSWQEKD